MKKTKLEKAITLVALIITIVVLLIVATVSIGVIKNSQIITYAQDAKNKYNKSQIEEEVALYFINYYSTQKISLKNTTSEEMIEICEKTGIKPGQLTVHYDLHNANKNKNSDSKLEEEYVLYRIDKTTEEERKTLEEYYSIKPLKGDVDLDGIITTNDVDMLSNFTSDLISLSEIQQEIGDVNGDGICDGNDVSTLSNILNGLYSYSEL